MDTQLTVRGTRWFGPDIFEIAFDRDELTFISGDCLALFDASGQESRPYSIASGINEDQIRFVIRRMPGGLVSGYLSERKHGDQVKISPPFGWFRPGGGKEDEPFIFLATGTGISPFLSYLRSHPERPPVRCYYGIRHLHDAVELDFIQSIADTTLAVSGEVVDQSHNGRLTDLLEDLPVSEKHNYYLCGLDSMIDEVSGWLESKDVPLANIHRECFFNAGYSV